MSAVLLNYSDVQASYMFFKGGVNLCDGWKPAVHTLAFLSYLSRLK